MKGKRYLGSGVAAALVVVLMAGLALAQAPEGTPLGTAFTYQGQLKRSGVPYTGTCDMDFGLYDALTGGTQVGIVTKTNVAVDEGVFTVLVDYGTGKFTGDQRYLGISVCCPAGSCGWERLSPRKGLTAVPYAQYALKAANTWSLTGNAGTTPGTSFLGTTDNQALEIKVNGERALRIEPDATSPNLIGGYSGNSVTSGHYGATIGGGGDYGYPNSVTGNYGTVSGGDANAAGRGATVGGGYTNVADGYSATVAGGRTNTASGQYATVGGGYSNAASGIDATVGGGNDNEATAKYATVGGGDVNYATAESATVAGGDGNHASGSYATVAGGYGNFAIVGQYTTVGGGYSNEATLDSATVGGGFDNDATGVAATVGGGGYNSAGGQNATVGGGYLNDASGLTATIGGGYENGATGAAATVGGGAYNSAGGQHATVGGGYSNDASGQMATIGGGNDNTAGGNHATIAGGYGNAANGSVATVAGGSSNTASGTNSFAAGYRAKANSNGCFVWGDNSNGDLVCDFENRWVARASGGVVFYTNGSLNSGVFVSEGGNSWSSVSDRNLKENVVEVDTQALLASLAGVPVTTWNYKSQDASIRHIGPMAQDFYAAFGVGEDDTHITTVDADGVALAAIQGLYAENQALKAENAAQQEQIDDLQKQNASLDARLIALEGAKPAQPQSRVPGLWLLAGGLVVAGGTLATRRRPGGGR